MKYSSAGLDDTPAFIILTEADEPSAHVFAVDAIQEVYRNDPEHRACAHEPKRTIVELIDGQTIEVAESVEEVFRRLGGEI